MPISSSNKLMLHALSAKLIREQSIYLQTNILVTSRESTRLRQPVLLIIFQGIDLLLISSLISLATGVFSSL